MLNSKELRVRAWNSLAGKYWTAFAASIVAGLVCSIAPLFTDLATSMIGITEAVDPSELDATLAAGALMISLMSLAVSIVGLLVTTFVSGPMNVGLCNFFNLNTEERPGVMEVFSGFKTKYGRNVGALLLMGIKELLWTLLFIVPGIIKAYEYAIIPYILAEDPEITTKEAFAKAKVMMTGNKWRLFKLNFSFIGWYALCMLTLGFGTFFLLPYVEAANAEFYKELKGE